ncbi:MAG: AAA family ATPase [Anaerolineales bacterium]|nr:AAA family ATPase [Anaerolineales bacterium]
MNNIIFITGMAGAGKSTVGRRVARYFPKSLFIQVDELREKMVKGYARPEGGVFTDEVIQQFQMARSTAIYMARLYADQGVDVIIDDVCVPSNFVEQYAKLFEIPEVHRVLLYPKASAVIERIKQRGGPMEHIDYVPVIYAFLDSMPKDGWVVLDSSEWTIEQTVKEVISHIVPGSSNKVT